MNRKILLLAAGITMTVHLTAQNPGQDFTNRMNHIFQYVDKNRVTTGLLSDYGLQMVDPAYFDGVPADSNYVDMDTWVMLFAGMYSSKINNNVSFPNPDTIFTQIYNATHPTAVPVTMMHYEYNALRDDAFTLGLMQVVNGDQLQDVPGAASPYSPRQLFAVAPKELYFGTTVSFVFNSNLWYSNVNKTVQKIEVKYDAETAFLLANWNTPVSFTFATGGVRTIYFRLTYTDGSSYTSQTNIYVSGPSIHPLTVKYKMDDSIPIGPSLLHSGGKIQIKYSSQNNSSNPKEIIKPLIVAEGFDPSKVLGKPDENNTIETFINGRKNDKKLGIPSPINSNGGRTLYDDLDQAGYDIIYLDYEDGVDDIMKNAQLFRQVIEWVNNNKQGTEQNVVMGMSMGGLVARIALRQMEIDVNNGVPGAQPHQTKKYISVDSPHKGANMPVGFQAAVRHIENTNVLLFASIFDMSVFPGPLQNISPLKSLFTLYGVIDLLNSPAAQQMLVYYIESPGLAQYLPWTSINFNNTVHNTFQSFYDSLGFPQQTVENITISNGSNKGNTPPPSGGQLFAPGSPIIDFNKSIRYSDYMNIMYGILFALPTYNPIVAPIFPQVTFNALTTSSDLKVEFKINALQDQSASMVYKGRIYIKKEIKTPWPFNNIVTNVDIENVTKNSESYMLPLDGAPGGMFDLYDFADNLPFSDNAIKESEFCFIPTGSALALSNWDNLTQTITSSTPKPPYLHSTFTQNNNEPHVDFNSSAMYFLGQLGIVVSIDGPNNVCYNGSTFSLIPSMSNTTWSVSHPFSFSSNSTVTTSTASEPTVFRIPGAVAAYGTLTAKVSGETVDAKALTPCHSSISGNNVICDGGSSTFTLTNPPLNLVWTTSSPFSITSGNTSTTVTVKKAAIPGVGVSLAAHSGSASGPIVASIVLYPCLPPGVNALIGPDDICTQAIYKLDPVQTANWSITPGTAFNLSNTTGTSTTVYNKTNGFATGMLTAEVNGKTISKMISAYPAGNCFWEEIEYVNMTNLSCGAYVHLIPLYDKPYSNPSDVYRWDVLYQDGVMINFQSGSIYSKSAELWFSPDGGSARIDVYRMYAWGEQPYPTVEYRVGTVSCSRDYSPIMAYPNPVSDILTVDVEALVSPTSGERFNSPVFDVRLYDGQGNLLRQQKTKGGTVEFNVSGLTDGVYYLHVYDGAGNTPEMRQIVVEH